MRGIGTRLELKYHSQVASLARRLAANQRAGNGGVHHVQ